METYVSYKFTQKKYVMDNKKENLEQEKQSKKEQAINKKATDGKEVNPQLDQRQEKHQPRDSA